MTFRIFAVLVLLFGAVFVLALMLFGRDPHEAAKSGPGWKRKLVAVGLLLLATIGITSGCGEGAGTSDDATISSTDFDTAIPPGQTLDETKHWKHLTAVWREAEEIGSGKRGGYPFDEMGKQRILGGLSTVNDNLDKLENAGLLDEAETGLLKQELALLTSRVQAKRPTEMRMATCYEPMSFTPAQDSLKRLTDRLPLIEKLADSETLQRQVISKVFDTVESDLALLEKQENRDRLPDDQKPTADEVTQAAKSYIEKMKAKLNDGNS